MFHRLGTFYVDQTVSVTIPPLYRLEHFRKQSRSNSRTNVGIPPHGNPASAPPRGFPPGHCEYTDPIELFAQAFWFFTRPYHISQDFERRRSSRISPFKPSSAGGLVQRVEFHSTRGDGYIPVAEEPLRPGRRQLRLARLVKRDESRVKISIHQLGGRLDTPSGFYSPTCFGSAYLRRARYLMRLTHQCQETLGCFENDDDSPSFPPQPHQPGNPYTMLYGCLCFRPRRRRHSAAGLVLTRAQDIDSWWAKMRTPFSKIHYGRSLLSIKVLRVPSRSRSPLQCAPEPDIQSPLHHGRRTHPDTEPLQPGEQLQPTLVVCS